MPNYTVVEGKHLVTSEPAWFITFADGPHVGLRQSLVGYKNADSAKRRIRDLKRKEVALTPATIDVVASLDR